VADTPTRTKEDAQIDAEVNEGGPAPSEPTPLEPMTEQTPRVLAVPKSEVPRPKPKKRAKAKRRKG
jgi:hypothetical protein